MTNSSDLFGEILEFPDPDAGKRFDLLVGLDEMKERFLAEAHVLISPHALSDWSKKHYGRVIGAAASVERRSPLLVLAGDVGTGKTELAETVGHPIATALRIGVTLFPLSLSARGRGLVGEMTSLITQSFAMVRSKIRGARDSAGRTKHAAILLIDEADALAQSRELAQMHHEDRAGVNSIIRGIDEIRRDNLPVLVLMCTNRADAIDPAILRRAANVFRFSRPNEDQRRAVLVAAFDGAGLKDDEIALLVRLTGPQDGRSYGCTYSDLRQRFVPTALLDALPRGPLMGKRLAEIAQAFEPTRPFGADEAS